MKTSETIIGKAYNEEIRGDDIIDGIKTALESQNV